MAKRKTIDENPLDAVIPPSQTGEVTSGMAGEFTSEEQADLRELIAWWNSRKNTQQTATFKGDEGLLDALLDALLEHAKAEGLTIREALSRAIMRYLSG